jgi:hypothetical protein
VIRTVSHELHESVRPVRVLKLMDLGFPLRQAQFLVHVLVFSGVFLERQYRAFTGIAHGQRTHDFLAKLIDRGYATAITPGAIHRGKIFHVQFKPLYEAIGEPDNRHRRAASLGRFVERLMLLDAVLADTRHTWLGTEHDKLAYFRAAIDMDLPDDFYPHVTYGHGAETTTRFFPEKLPIGVPRAGHRRHVFVYLATREVPMDFRVFLLRHADLLPRVTEWTLRVLVPRRLKKAVALYRYAVRDAFMMPLTPHDVEEVEWYFRGRRGDVVRPSPDPRLDLPTAAKKFGAARFDALYREWLRRDWRAFWAAQSTLVRDQLQRGDGRIEFVELPHQYLQLTPLIGAASGAEKAEEAVDNLATV